MKKAGIIGYGRFGKVLVDLLSKKYQVRVFDIDPKKKDCGELCTLEEVLECILVFLAVPIRSFETVVNEISKHKLYNTTIIDVCSVKVYPVKIMENFLSDSVTNPYFSLFGSNLEI